MASESLLDHVLNKIEQETMLSPTFSDGLAGVGITILLLQETTMIDGLDNEFFTDLDRYLGRVLDKSLQENDLDPLHGALGIATYFVKRKRTDVVSNVIRTLMAFRENSGGETRFSYYYDDKLSWVYDLGLAHGMAGILSFLTTCCDAGFMERECQEMISGIMTFYDNNTQNHDLAGSWFGNFIQRDTYGQPRLYETSRLAWCYGDLGILYSLYQAAGVIKDPVRQKNYETMLTTTARRTTYEQTFVENAGICHGSSGIAMLYLLLYGQSGNKIFYDACEYWHDITRQLLSPIEYADPTSYTFTKDTTADDIFKKGMLYGLTGIGFYLQLQQLFDEGKWESVKSWKSILLI
jgi:lantibiotic modifying enzyme